MDAKQIALQINCDQGEDVCRRSDVQQRNKTVLNDFVQAEIAQRFNFGNEVLDFLRKYNMLLYKTAPVGTQKKKLECPRCGWSLPSSDRESDTETSMSESEEDSASLSSSCGSKPTRCNLKRNVVLPNKKLQYSDIVKKNNFSQEAAS